MSYFHSADFISANSPQEVIMEVPPLEMKGTVTPVRGRISTEPSTFSVVCKRNMAAEPQAAIA